MFNGVLVIDKSSGPTSHDVVDSVRKILKMRKVGHTGTLDPAATGVLPIVLGKATKLSRYLTGTKKSYRGTIYLGVQTHTLDAEGDVVKESPVDVSPEEISAALERFRGQTEQTPPMFSAKKIDGKRLYELARQGVEVERPSKTITIDKLELVKAELPELVIDVTCSAGTYIRVLAEDIGSALGCGAHLAALRRTAVGPFSLEDAITLDELADVPELVNKKLVSMTQALRGLPRIELPGDLVRLICQGYQLTVADLNRVDLPDFTEETALILTDETGAVAAIARALLPAGDIGSVRRDTRALKTERVFSGR